MTESLIDWKQEAGKLKEGFDRNWWKPTAGQHKIKILTDGEKYSYEFQENDGTKTTINKIRFGIEVSGNKFDWGITQGLTERSLYGQLVLIGQNKGSLRDEVITLLVKGSGKQSDYTVLEALPLMTTKEEQVDTASAG